MAHKGDWVRVHSVVLTKELSETKVPGETGKVKLEKWVKGRLTCDAEIGEHVEVITRTGRTAEGCLVEVNPGFSPSFGDFVPELLEIGDTVRAIVFGEDKP